MKPRAAGETAPAIELPGITTEVRTDRLKGAPLVIEFLRGTW